MTEEGVGEGRGRGDARASLDSARTRRAKKDPDRARAPDVADAGERRVGRRRPDAHLRGGVHLEQVQQLELLEEPLEDHAHDRGLVVVQPRRVGLLGRDGRPRFFHRELTLRRLRVHRAVAAHGREERAGEETKERNRGTRAREERSGK
jgi:hypothetical protein